jgi:hypothetical protein
MRLSLVKAFVRCNLNFALVLRQKPPPITVVEKRAVLAPTEAIRLSTLGDM